MSLVCACIAYLFSACHCHCLFIPQLNRAYCELEKRIYEHDTAKDSGFERTDITLQVMDNFFFCCPPLPHPAPFFFISLELAQLSWNLILEFDARMPNINEHMHKQFCHLSLYMFYQKLKSDDCHVFCEVNAAKCSPGRVPYFTGYKAIRNKGRTL
jgi:hypothetical protein